MIENNEFFVYSVGANCVRPFGHTVNRAGELKEAPTNNNHRICVILNMVRPFKSLTIFFYLYLPNGLKPPPPPPEVTSVPPEYEPPV